MDVTIKAVQRYSREESEFLALVARQWKENTVDELRFLPVRKVLVAQTNEDVIGGVMISYTKNANYCIPYFLVAEGFTGQGVGSRLMAACKAFCKYENADMDIQIMVEQWNTRSRRFFQRHGFMLIEKIKSYYQDGQDGYGSLYVLHSDSANSKLRRRLKYTGLEFP